MSYCLNPHCQQPQNQKNANTCLTCGTKLLLKQRYRAIKQIGQGGFGRTLLAVDESKTLKPPCVIKQFLPQAQGTNNIQKAAELFEQEVLRLDNLGRHSQIPNLLDYLNQEEYQYLVQEYVDGYDLAQILSEQGTFKEAQIWELLNSLLPVLKFIHKNEVIHRDIKPQNIIHSRNKKIYLVDFGAAKVVTGTAILQTGTSIGTPEFVAPEQSRGKATYSSDLYSLGVTCIYLLTGVSPFDLFDISEFTWVWRQYLVDNPVSDKLSYILDKLIENATSRRYQSVDEVLQDINHKITTTGNQNSDIISENRNLINKKSHGNNQLVESLNYYNWQYVDMFTSKNVTTIDVSPNAKILISGDYYSGLIKLWQISTGRILNIIDLKTPIYDVAISPNGLIIASSYAKNDIYLWNANFGKKILKGHKGLSAGVNSLSFSPDSKFIASGSGDKTIKLWDLNTEQEISTFVGHHRCVNSVAISPDGKFIASGSTDKTAILWDLKTGKAVNILKHSGLLAAVRSVAFSPDGKIIATGSEDCTIKLWKVVTGQEICTLKGHSLGIRYVTFNPKVEILASGCDSGTIKLWDINTKQEICTLKKHSAKVNSMVFSSDGKTLFSASDDRTIRIWQCE